MLPLACPRRPGPAADAALVLDGVRVAADPGTTQVVTVNHTSGHRARVTFWRLVAGTWVARTRTTDGRIGFGGLVRRRPARAGHRDDAPRHLRTAVGLRHPPARATRGRWTTGGSARGDYWVQDNASPHYNRYRSRSEGGFRWWLPASDVNASERLTDYRRPYEWSIVTGFNLEQVRHRGSGIFLHVNGRGATAGCVSAPRRFLRMLVRRLDPAAAPVIAIGR